MGDVFLGDGSGNIHGLYTSVGDKMGPVTATFIYHQLSSDDSSVLPADDLGSEMGLALDGKAGPVGILAKFADYSADDFGADTTKFWLMASLSF